MAHGPVFEEFEESQEWVSDGRTVTESDIRMYTGATGLSHPLHDDREHAANHPLVDDIVLPGTLLLGMTDRFFVDEIAGDAALAMNYGHDKVRYPTAVIPGDTVHAKIKVIETERQNEDWGRVKFLIELINQDGEAAVVDEHNLVVATEANEALEAMET